LNERNSRDRLKGACSHPTLAGNQVFSDREFMSSAKSERRRMKTRILSGIVLALSLMNCAFAQDYPNRPITLIVPFPAGGPSDVIGRTIAEAAQKHLGQPIIVDNKGGGGGTLGPTLMAATAKPDGYTISMVHEALYRVQIMQKTTYDVAKDFTYILNLAGFAYGVLVPADSQFKDWQQVVDYARQNPGKVTYGTPGAATGLHIGMERISRHSGIKLVHVPFKGSAESQTAAMGGHVMLSATGSSAKPLVDAGKLRFLQIWTSHRLASFPDTPTLRELGYPFDINAITGLAGPKGMDPKIVAKLHDAFKKALEDKQVQDVMRKLELSPLYMSGEDLKKTFLTNMEIERPILQELGVAK